MSGHTHAHKQPHCTPRHYYTSYHFKIWNEAFPQDAEWGANSHSLPALLLTSPSPITAATLMQILKRAELAGKLCIAMAMRTGRNPFFIDRHCWLGYAECNACDIKRKESQGEKTKHTQNSLMSDRKSSKTRLEKVVLSTVLGLSVGLLQLIREAQFVWAPHREKSHTCIHTRQPSRQNDGFVCRPWICQNFIFDWRQETTMFGLTQNCHKNGEQKIPKPHGGT